MRARGYGRCYARDWLRDMGDVVEFGVCAYACARARSSACDSCRMRLPSVWIGRDAQLLLLEFGCQFRQHAMASCAHVRDVVDVRVRAKFCASHMQQLACGSCAVARLVDRFVVCMRVGCGSVRRDACAHACVVGYARRFQSGDMRSHGGFVGCARFTTPVAVYVCAVDGYVRIQSSCRTGCVGSVTSDTSDRAQRRITRAHALCGVACARRCGRRTVAYARAWYRRVSR